MLLIATPTAATVVADAAAARRGRAALRCDAMRGCRSLFALIRDMVGMKGSAAAAEEEEREERREGFEQV